MDFSEWHSFFSIFPDKRAALKYSEDGNVVRFRIGERIYDKNAESNTRWVSSNVKAFGNLAERIRKMQFKDGSCINLTGRYDEDVWTDLESGETRSQPVIILDNVEFAGFSSESEAERGSYHSEKSNFEGHESFGNGSFFYEG